MAIRSALTQSSLALNNLLDRRQIEGISTNSPLILNLISARNLGVGATLLLSLVANILLSSLNIHSRRTNFAVLRALGAAPAQVRQILIWEQSITLAIALLMGLLFGTLLVLTDVLPANVAMLSDNAIYTLQRVIPVALVFPPSLGLAMAMVLLFCLLALGLMSYMAQRSLLSQALRLNED